LTEALSVRTVETVAVDGRRLRREQNREAVLDALLELFREGEYEPATNDIAERAGVSPRSLFRYFPDVADVHRSVVARQLARAQTLVVVDVDPGAPTVEKVDALVAVRLRLFDEIAPAARAIRVCAHRHPVLAKQLADGRTYLRAQIRRLFRAELAGRDFDLLPALDVLCSFESYELLRFDQGLSRPKAAAALTAAVLALLS
jgi:TetR/AcrR family transcriptional regulator, regulator of autoinduction and epiphytic fitness